MTTLRLVQKGKKKTWWAVGSLPGNQKLRRSLKTTDRAEAEQRKAALERDLMAGVRPQASLTVKQWLDEWYGGEARRGRAPTSLSTYRTYIDRYLVPRVGKIRLHELTVGDVERLDADLMRRGGKDGKALGAVTVRSVHAMLSGAIHEAQRHSLVLRNVAALARTPDKPREVRPKWLKRQEAALLLKAAIGHRWGAVTVTAIYTGLRAGELCGLRWADVDLASGLMNVERQRRYERGRGYQDAAPKSAAGVRSVPLHAEAVTWLREHHEAQIRACKAAKADSPEFVFSHRRKGQWVPWSPKAAALGVASVYTTAGLEAPTRPIHTLRHTLGRTLAREDAKLRAELLGHQSIETTMHYTHPDEEDLRQAMDETAGRVTGGERKRG